MLEKPTFYDVIKEIDDIGWEIPNCWPHPANELLVFDSEQTKEKLKELIKDHKEKINTLKEYFNRYELLLDESLDEITLSGIKISKVMIPLIEEVALKEGITAEEYVSKLGIDGLKHDFSTLLYFRN